MLGRGILVVLQAATIILVASAQNLNCGFEKDFCKWNLVEWDEGGMTRLHGWAGMFRKAPMIDHTTKTPAGHYLYVDAKDSAQIISPAVPVNTKSCLVFFYSMGSGLQNKITVYTIADEKQLSSPFWTEALCPRDTWTGALVRVPPGNRIEIVIEARFNISIDDIAYFPETRCSEELYDQKHHPASTMMAVHIDCYFDDGTLCSWRQDSTDDFDWSFNSGNTKTAWTGPAGDHSTSDGSGKYIYIKADGPSAGAKARIVSKDVTRGGFWCLKFWYNMFGRHIGTLSVYTKTGASLSNPIWSKFGSRGRDWLYAEVELDVKEVFKVIFEGVKGPGNEGDIALDDISMVAGSCEKAQSGDVEGLPYNHVCTFDSDTCGFTQGKTNNFDWLLESGEDVESDSAPPKDHTFGTSTGKYLYAKAPNIGLNAKAAVEFSPMIAHPPQSSCLTFWYSSGENDKTSLQVFVIKAGQGRSRSLWTEPATQDSGWREAIVNVDSNSVPFTLVFETASGMGYESDIAIDDVMILDKECPLSGSSRLSYLPFQCTFESGECGFTQGDKDNYDWSLHRGSTKTRRTGPKADRTTGTITGHYFYAEASGNERREGEKAILVSPIFPAASTHVCLEFYYHMYGSTMGALNLKTRSSGKTEASLWTIEGDLGDQWNKATVTLHAPLLKSPFQFLFEAIRGRSFYSDIAIDDVILREGSCNNPATCNFDQGTCSFTQSKNDDFDWIRRSGSTDSSMTGPNDDHTHRSSDGYYMYLESSSPRLLGEKAVLKSESLPATDGSCLTFWYYMAGAGIGTLNIKLATSPIHNQVIWSLSGPQRNAWLFGQVPVQYPYSDFFIYVEGIRGFNYTGDIAVDDIVFHNAECKTQPPQAKDGLEPVGFLDVKPTSTDESFCSFDDDFCQWQQDSGALLSWKIQSDTTAPGPIHDHSGDGSFAVVDIRSLKKDGESATLTSPELTDRRCLSFWYYMWGDNVGTLKVFSGEKLYWIRDEATGSQWRQASIYLKNDQKGSSYQVKMEAVVRETGGVAIDDVSSKKGPCTKAPTGSLVQGQQSCDFENDLCDYYDRSDGKFQWKIIKASKIKMAPSKDHTYGTTQGHYLYIDKDVYNSANEPAILVMSIYGAESDNSGLCLDFWYYMSGSSSDDSSLAFFLGQHKELEIWREKGNQGQAWHHALARIPHFKGDQIDILVYGEVSKKQHIATAIDDVFIRKGSCYAYGAKKIGDCNFGIDFCTWAPDESGNMNWLISQGPSKSLEIGPSAGQQKDLAGYIYIDSSFPIPIGSSAILMSQLFSPQDASCFHFHYNMYGASVGTLRLWLATYDANADSLSMLDKELLWDLSGSQGQGWKEGKVSGSSQKHYRIFIEGIKGLSDTGNIALADFVFTTEDEESCVTTPSNAVPKATPGGASP